MEMKSSGKPNIEHLVEHKRNPSDFSLYISTLKNGTRERRGTVADMYSGSSI